MNLTINYTLDEASLAKFLQRVAKFQNSAESFGAGRNTAYRQMLDEADQLMRNRWRMNFNSGGGMYGAWWPLDPDTIAEKGGRVQPLVRTGAMRGKFFSDMFGKRSVQGLNWSFRNYHGLIYHHFGTRHEYKRPLVGFNDNDRSSIATIVAKHARKFVSLSWQQG